MDTNKPGPSTQCVPSVVWQSPGTHVIHVLPVTAGTALHLLGASPPTPCCSTDGSSQSLCPSCGEAMAVWRWALADPPRRFGGTRVLLADPELGWWGRARLPLEPAPERARTPRDRLLGGRCPGQGNATGGARGPERPRRAAHGPQGAGPACRGAGPCKSHRGSGRGGGSVESSRGVAMQMRSRRAA